MLTLAAVVAPAEMEEPGDEEELASFGAIGGQRVDAMIAEDQFSVHLVSDYVGDGGAHSGVVAVVNAKAGGVLLQLSDHRGWCGFLTRQAAEFERVLRPVLK